MNETDIMQWAENREIHMRDEFAAAALCGFLASFDRHQEVPTPERAATYAYLVADAMLLERQRPRRPDEELDKAMDAGDATGVY